MSTPTSQLTIRDVIAHLHVSAPAAAETRIHLAKRTLTLATCCKSNITLFDFAVLCGMITQLVFSRALDYSDVWLAGSILAASLSPGDIRQVVHTRVTLFTKIRYQARAVAL